jgi:hypothetical protein
MGKAVLKDFNPEEPIRDILKRVWFNMFDYICKHADFFHFTEQFSNSPYSSLVKKEEVEKSFEPMIKILLKGIEQKIIKDVNHDILATFIFYPIITLSNARLCTGFEKNEKNIEMAFTLAWDAIKL